MLTGPISVCYIQKNLVCRPALMLPSIRAIISVTGDRKEIHIEVHQQNQKSSYLTEQAYCLNALN